MPSIWPLCFSNQDDSRCHIMSYHLATAASFLLFFPFSPFPKKFMWNITFHRETSKSITTHVYAPFIRKLHFMRSRVTQECWGKAKILTCSGRLTDTLTDNICLSMTSSVCSVTPGVTAGYLHTKVSERLTSSDVTRSELHRNANKDSKKTCLRRQSQTVFTWMAILSRIHLFLLHLCVHFLFPPSSFCLEEDV